MSELKGSRTTKAGPGSGTWTRRSLLSWLGRGCVFSLAGGGVSGCLGSIAGEGKGTWTRCTGGGFAFSPGRCDFSGWGERTVDPQTLDNILAGWKISVGGLVEEELTLTFDELVALPSHNPVVDFHCVEGWSVFDVPWNGVHLSELFTRARVKPEATHVNFHTLGGDYNESLPLSVAFEANTILACGIGGSSLSLKHGFPARIVIPRLYGYKSAKFVDGIELSDHPIEGYWVRWGYSYGGEVPPSQLRDGKY
jgi:DMSO/TMAO reductase YedYZ molybdopterin-dependent catalytic subunit